MLPLTGCGTLCVPLPVLDSLFLSLKWTSRSPRLFLRSWASLELVGHRATSFGRASEGCQVMVAACCRKSNLKPEGISAPPSHPMPCSLRPVRSAPLIGQMQGWRNLCRYLPFLQHIPDGLRNFPTAGFRVCHLISGEVFSNCRETPCSSSCLGHCKELSREHQVLL